MSLMNSPQKKALWKKTPLLFGIVLSLSISLTACETANPRPGSSVANTNTQGDPGKFLIVDCLLPGQVRKLGQRMTYLSPRRPVKTTASECEIRGGEYVAYDRADYRTSLNVWLPRAREGEPTAQNYVGEIYEKGLGIQPDYATAAAWYRKAADQGLSRAQINLGFLYEKGLGVKKDLAQALNWYRKASGLEQDDLLFASSVEASPVGKNELEQLRQEATRGRNQTAQLRQQLDEAERQLTQQKNVQRQTKQKLVSLQSSSRKPAVPQVSGQTSELQSKLQQQETEVRLQQRRISELEAAIARQQSQMSRERQTSEQEKQALLADLEQQTSETEALKRKLQETQNELSQAKQLIADNTPKLEQERKKYRQAQTALTAKEAAIREQETEVKRLESELQLREGRLGLEGAAVTRLREKAKQYRAKLVELELARIEDTSALQRDIDERNSQIEQLQRKLDEAQQALNQGQAQLNQLNPDLAKKQARLERVQRELVKAKTSAARKGAELERLRSAEKQYEATVNLQKQKIARLRSEALRYRSQLARNMQRETRQEQTIELAGPSIEILDPPIVLTRGLPSVRLRSSTKERLITGKVSAPAGLLSLTINDRREQPDEFGIFTTRVAIGKEQTPVQLVAVDKKGRQASIEFLFIPKTRNIKASASQAAPDSQVKPGIIAGQVNFGNYYALIIGNNDYRNLPILESAAVDAQETARVLRSKYGFKTTLLIDATRYDILSALNELREKLSESDNLLIYYAGHGELDRVNLRGHWLPVDAEPDNSANWISNVAITDILNAMQAKHVMVVADSCYSGSMTRSSVPRLDTGMPEKLAIKWLKVMAKTRSRTVLTSGGLSPVLDQGGGKHSVFARSFLQALTQNDTILEGFKLYQNLSQQVQKTAAQYGIDQVPEYAPIRYGGHEAGEFFFIPRA